MHSCPERTVDFNSDLQRRVATLSTFVSGTFKSLAVLIHTLLNSYTFR